ncbi:MAG: Ryanodine receptor Ryr [Lentisphaeria bacterium]|nr:Ryanodine receptor Ryr [Lentisphaeria bacterium]
MSYKPETIHASATKLDDALNDLLEALAENVHDQWASGRLAEGWKYGSERNDKEKLHPCLVPYNELPESEKEYDRNTAKATLKFIQNAGYKIVKK